jgi:hypothetical protein
MLDRKSLPNSALSWLESGTNTLSSGEPMPEPLAPSTPMTRKALPLICRRVPSGDALPYSSCATLAPITTTRERRCSSRSEMVTPLCTGSARTSK